MTEVGGIYCGKDKNSRSFKLTISDGIFIIAYNNAWQPSKGTPMKLRYNRHILLFSVCVAVMFSGTSIAAESVNWYSYTEGMALGKIEKKRVFLHFYADWCGYCVKMAKDTFQDATVVAYLNENFIPIRVNVDREQETAGKYAVIGLPLTIFLTEMGEPILSIPGYVPADTLIPVLKDVKSL
jgi:thioredoxin-related protein